MWRGLADNLIELFSLTMTAAISSIVDFAMLLNI